MPAIDHLVYAVPDLETGVAAIADLTGVQAVAGGSHPGAGTRNALLSFGDDTYLEIISVDPDQPDHHGPRPFGVDADGPVRMASFAIHPVGDETIESVTARLADRGFDPGPVAAMSRRRPDGVELSWRLTRAVESPLGRANPETDGVVPFLIDWGPTPNPARSTPRVGRLAELRIAHPDRAVVDAVASLGLEVSGGIVRVTAGGRALVAVVELADGRIVEIA